MRRLKKIVLLGMVSLLEMQCSFAPKYTRPELSIPVDYKEQHHWQKALPQANLDRGPWFEIYQDPILNELELQVMVDNQNIKAAIARFEQARAVVATAETALLPNILGIINTSHAKGSSTVTNPLRNLLFSDVITSAILTYEIDVWGKVRNTVAMAKHLEQASKSDLSTMTLSLQSELAIQYFALRASDEEIRVLQKMIQAYATNLSLTEKRYRDGIVSIVDVDEAKTILYQTKTILDETRLSRARMEHAIAVLMGRPPALFTLKPTNKPMKQVTISPDLPSVLLERRPDVAAAESKVLAANANIGVTRAAFFPSFNITTAIGLESANLANLFKAPSLIWSLGPSTLALYDPDTRAVVAQTLFDAGRLSSLNRYAWQIYCEIVANYRQTVLKAFQEVEDSLVAIKELDNQTTAQKMATLAANRAAMQTHLQYTGGIKNYLEVMISDITALQNQLSLIDIKARRQIASVQLIKALGGGWFNPKDCGGQCKS